MLGAPGSSCRDALVWAAAALGEYMDSRRLGPFVRFFGQIDPDTPLRQERQIVQSQLDLQDFLP